jgi:hypothetical protein
LARKGQWHREGKELKPAPWQATYANANLSNYESFYYVASKSSEAEFIQEYGPLYGTPSGSNLSSWSGRNQMQPRRSLLSNFGLAIDGNNVGYIMHSVQRIAVDSSSLKTEIPPSVITDRTEYDALVVSAFSPLNEAPDRTLIVRFSP